MGHGLYSYTVQQTLNPLTWRWLGLAFKTRTDITCKVLKIIHRVGDGLPGVYLHLMLHDITILEEIFHPTIFVYY